MLEFGAKYFIVALAGAALMVSSAAQARSLQHVADDAALAAVQVLGRGGAPTAAVATAVQVAAIPGMTAQVNASGDDLAVTVKLSASESGGAQIVTSTARYIPPEQPAAFNWASRQRFAVKPAELVVGSFCLRDCEQDRIR